MAEQTKLIVSESVTVSALLDAPEPFSAVCVLGHGAGAGMTHDFMERLARELTAGGLATLRYNFPYMEAGRSRPDHQSKLLATVRAALVAGERVAAGKPLFAGGKSMGGRMTSLVLAEAEVSPTVRGLVYFGFPLHPAGEPSMKRAEHLARIPVPQLFLQGTRDELADLQLIETVTKSLGSKARLEIVAGADHSFNVLKRSGRSADEVFGQLIAATLAFCQASS